MTQSEEIVINNLLCFLSSARNDHSRESLLDMAYSFYSHEEIKLAKQNLQTLLKETLCGDGTQKGREKTWMM